MTFATYAPYAPSSSTSLTDSIANLGCDPANRDLATSNGLSIVNVSWEDVGRNKNSCFGPNICDMTLFAGRNMPALRKPNFSDITSDVSIDSFAVTIGNENSSGTLRRVSLKDYISKTLNNKIDFVNFATGVAALAG